MSEKKVSKANNCGRVKTAHCIKKAIQDEQQNQPTATSKTSCPF